MNNNQLPLVTYEQAKILRTVGYNWPAYTYYNNKGGLCHGQMISWNEIDDHYSAPTIALALKWLRDVKGFKYAIFYDLADMEWFVQFGEDDEEQYLPEPHGSEYESAESALLDEILTLLENGK